MYYVGINDNKTVTVYI